MKFLKDVLYWWRELRWRRKFYNNEWLNKISEHNNRTIYRYLPGADPLMNELEDLRDEIER